MARHYAAALVIGLTVAGVAPAPQGAMAADLYVQEGTGTCDTIFIGLPVPPYFVRHGCMENVITVHRLPESRQDDMILEEREVLIEYRSPLIRPVYK